MEGLITYRHARRTGPWREIAPDILSIPFWTLEFCHQVINAAELLDEFKPYEPDVQNNAAPGQELRINRISPRFAENFAEHVQQYLVPILRAHWWPLKLGPIRMPFVLRYSGETQASLDPHHDAAMVSLAMPLNDGFRGGELTFPRQRWNAANVPIGNIIAFPSRVTHVHWVTEVTEGTRYAMTCWIAEPNARPDDAI